MHACIIIIIIISTLARAPETGNLFIETARWLKRQHGNRYKQYKTVTITILVRSNINNNNTTSHHNISNTSSSSNNNNTTNKQSMQMLLLIIITKRMYTTNDDNTNNHSKLIGTTPTWSNSKATKRPTRTGQPSYAIFHFS